MIELKERRTQSEAHFDLGDGKFAVSIGANGAALHYFNALGKGDGEQRWRKCDQTVLPDDKGGWRVEFMPYTAHVPQRANGVATYIDQLSDGVKSKNRRLELWADCDAVEGKIDNTSFSAPAVVYLDAFGKGSDLIYIFLRSGLGKWVRVRAGESANPAYTFEVKLPAGATVKRLGEGAYELGKQGPKTLDKPRITEITDGAEGATYFSPVRAWWGRGSCDLPIEVENVGGDTWRVTKSAPTEWDGTTDLFMDLTTTGTLVTSNHYSSYKVVYDATPKTEAYWITCHDATLSDGFDAYGIGSMYVIAGWVDGASDYWVCSRGRLAFTNTIPVGSTVVVDAGTNIVVNKSADAGSGYSQNLLFVASTQASPSALVAADFDNYSQTPLTEEKLFTTGIANGTYTFALTAAGAGAISIGGTTMFAFMSKADVEDNYAGTDAVVSSSINMSFTSPNGGTVPVLNLVYTPPPVGGNPNAFMMMGIG